MIVLSSTNPCHIYDMACVAFTQNIELCYFSGYPKWKLSNVPKELNIVSISLRTVVTYALLKYISPRFRPSDAWLFRWQDSKFDCLVARYIRKRKAVRGKSQDAKGKNSSQSFIHAMPGQCLETFKAAKELEMITVLNHPTGPVGMQLDAVRSEYERVGLPMPDQSEHARYLLSLESKEYELADYHCVASSVVKEQLLKKGVEEQRIWVVSYGADPKVWRKAVSGKREAGSMEVFRIVFAGQLSLRKGFRFLLEALEIAGDQNWCLDVYGRIVEETKQDRNQYSGSIPVTYHGAVNQATLAVAFGQAHVLVLPSLEEGFGLVVPQALSCGTPCIVSDRVGAKDLIREGENGSIFECGNSEALAQMLHGWSQNRLRLDEQISWDEPAKRLIEYSREAVKKG